MDERDEQEARDLADVYGVDPAQLEGTDGRGSPGRVRMLALAAAEQRRTNR